ncbi:M3 family metallopeptidase [Streptomyces sp. SBST2-5]|uniref:M3 family metallopeptidase n=1 Tax=Streptomyces composti TaxID=2720025 RepID=A0ABX1AJ18_9ACTN|nr:M3 family metallopeptidase [Streptomyces composti]NJP53788.1 M3 family metallopeptidase [Streptomyces composti]
MSVDTLTAPDRASVAAMDESLHGMMARLRAIIAEPALTQDLLVEIVSIYNNVAYVFLYLEANERHVNYDRLLPWRDRFYNAPEIDERLIALLEPLRCADPEAEESRHRLLEQLRHKSQAPDLQGDERIAELLAEAKDVLHTIQQDQLDLLKRLGVNVGGAGPAAVFYRLTSGTTDTARRAKLVRAWRMMRDRHQDALVAAVDGMIAEQRRQSSAAGYETTLDQTLRKCGVPQATIADFLEHYLDQALRSYDALAARVQEVTGATESPMDHFGAFMRTVSGTAPLPQFPLAACLDFVFAVARTAFGLEVRPVSGTHDHVLTCAVRAGDEEIGHIHFDLWDTDHKTLKANTTTGIRNRTDWSGLVQRPVAYVSCRFRRSPDGVRHITFQNVHSLFHEFGHAVNHLLIRKRIPNQSGLEYLPLERLENLSMWFERWVFHPEFGRHLPLSAQDRDGLAQCQRIKKLEYQGTYVDRAVTAALDFEIHRRPQGGVLEAFHRLEERFGISRHCSVGDFLTYFTWPMLRANPGAYFSYLWGAAQSAEMFAPYQRLSLEQIPAHPKLRSRFTACFDYDAPSQEPDCTAAFAFYEDDSDQEVSVA